MSVKGLDTYKPLLYYDVVGGNLSGEELAARTLSLSYVDRRRDFDHIEWKLDNRDGYLTHPENICVGLMVRLAMGYADAIIPWKAFVVNRIRGGVGVYGKENAAVGSNEGTVTYYGRNRNAPGGRTSPHWRRKVSPPRKKPVKNYGPTEDIIAQEMILMDNNNYPRTIFARTVSEAVTQIAARHGFIGLYSLIEDTDEHIESITIPAGQSDGEFLNNLAGLRGWVFKIDNSGYLHWHSPNWKKANQPQIIRLVYGDGNDIKDLQIDNDFRLPVPTKVKARGVNYKTRLLLSRDATADLMKGTYNAGSGFWVDAYADPVRQRTLTREEFLPIVGHSDQEALGKAARKFVERHTRAFQISANCVGNPLLLANRFVELAGTGTSLVDGIWVIGEARHEFQDSYQTKIILLPPPRNAKVQGGYITFGQTRDDKANLAKGQFNAGTWAWDSRGVQQPRIKSLTRK